MLVFQPIVMAVGSPFAGRLSDRVEPRIVASVGMALTAMGLFFLRFLASEYIPWEYFIADLVLLGSGFALFSSPNTNAVMSSVEKVLRCRLRNTCNHANVRPNIQYGMPF